MDEKIVGLADSIKTGLEKMSKAAEIENYIGRYKVIAVVSGDGVSTRIAEPPKKRVIKKRLPEQDIKKIKEVRETVKNNLDTSVFVTLLMRIHEELKRINIDNLPDKIRKMSEEVSKELSVKLLEAK